MLFDFNLKSALLFVFFFHGLVFSALLLSKGIANKDKPAFWLSLFTLLCSLYIAPFMLGYAGWYSKDPYRSILFYIPFQQLLLFPAVLYFYCKTLFDKSCVFRRSDLLHFLPAIFYLLYSLMVFVTDKVVLNSSYFYADGKDKDFSAWYQVTGFALLLFYLVRSLKLYKQYRYITYNTYSYADTLTFKWAQRFLITLLLLLCLRGLFFILNPEWAQFGRKFWYYLSFSLLFYYISISGYINAVRSITSFKDWSSQSKKQEAEIVAPSEANKAAGDKTAEAQQEMPDLAAWKNKVEALMLYDRMYENAELSILELSQHLGTHAKKISQVINKGFGMNFNDWVNGYRVQAVIKKMEEGEHSMQTLLGLAFDCGFNSKSTFNRAFKKHTSMSPNDYIQQKLKK